MQLRRGLIAFAVVFAVVAFISALTAPSGDDEPAPPTGPAPRTSTPAAVELAFRHPVEEEPPVRSVRRGTHAIVRVQAQVAGDVEIAGLGLIEPVTPGTPAVFDLLASRAGRFEVRLISVAGERTLLGVIEVNE